MVKGAESTGPVPVDVTAAVNEGFDREGLAMAVRTFGSVIRVVVADYRGSTPREAGAAMLVWNPSATDAERAPGESDHPPRSALGRQGQSGTIGGGALEWQAAAAARRLPDTPWARRLMRLPLGPALGQCCGGQVTLLLERYGAGELAWLEANPVDPFIRPVASGARPEAAEFEARRVLRAARSGEAPQVAWLGRGLFIERLAEPARPLWLYGAGHVGRAIVRALEDLPLAVTWIDSHADRFPDPFPRNATRLIAKDPARAVAYAPANAIHLVLTYSHALDLAICQAVLGRPHRHLGLIGSASKKARFTARLREAGMPEPVLARLNCPIGDRTLGKRPAAIAIGVAAELLRLVEPMAAKASR